MGQKVKILDALIWVRQNLNFLSKDWGWSWHSEEKKVKMEGLLVLKEETVATSLAGLVCDPSAFIVEEYSEEVGTSPLFFFEWSNMIFLGWWFQRCRGHEHCPRGLHWPWAKYDHVWGGFSTQYKTTNRGSVFCLQNIVVSGARSWLELWPNVSWRGLPCWTGLSLIFGQKNNNSQSNCPAGQVWV